MPRLVDETSRRRYFASMTAADGQAGGGPTRTRREPPQFRQIVLCRVEHLTPRMVRASFAGPDLEGFTVEHPAASVRLLIPTPDAQGLIVPVWNGNEFLMPDGTRPVIRTFTPRRVDPDPPALDLDIVIHEGGAVSAWVAGAALGDPAAVSGPGRGYGIERETPAFLLAGDETAIPAISQLLEHLPRDATTQVHIEVAHPNARLVLPEHPRATVVWHDMSPAGAGCQGAGPRPWPFAVRSRAQRRMASWAATSSSL